MKKLLCLTLLIPSLGNASNINVIVDTNAVNTTIERHALTPLSTHHFVQIDNRDNEARDFYIQYYHCFGSIGCFIKEKNIRIKAHENFVEDFNYPQNIRIDNSGQYTITAMTQVRGKAIRNYVKIDRATLYVK